MQLPAAVRRGSFPIVVTLALSVAPAAAQDPALPDLPVTKLEAMAGGEPQPGTQPITRISGDAELDGPRLLSMTFPRVVPIRDVLMLLVRDTAFSAVVDASVKGVFSGELRNLTVRQALEAVLFPSGLDYDVRRTVIQVFPRRPRTRLFQLDLLAVRRSWQSRDGSAAGAVVSATESDAFSEIDRGISALLTPQGRHHVDRRAGLVQVTDFADRLDQVGVYLETVQLRATRQVRIDVRILRVTPSGAPSGSASPVPAIAGDAAELLSSLRRSATVDIIASPSVLTMNNEPAMVRVADSGAQEISLVVTPQISADGFVQLSVVPVFSPRAEARSEADWVVRVKEGQTVMISALPHGPGRDEWLVLLTPWLDSPVEPRTKPGTR